jgi:hypothetical protein
MAGAESQGESRWKGDDESRGAEPEIEERDAERLAREAAEEAEEEDAPPGAAAAEEEGEW